MAKWHTNHMAWFRRQISQTNITAKGQFQQTW